MSRAHIEAIRTQLENNNWVVLEERLVDDDRVHESAFWDVARPDGTNRLTLAFKGGYPAEKLRKRTFDESYGCHVVEHPDVRLYFARIHRSWDSELSRFIRELNQLG